MIITAMTLTIMVAVALVITILLLVSIIGGLVVVKRNLLKQDFKKFSSKLATALWSEGFRIVSDNAKHPFRTYFKRKFISLIALILCITFIVSSFI